MYRYAVIDLETTGIYPGGHDRILEIAVLGLGEDLAPAGEFTTLLNPGRDLGPSWLHGIQAADVLGAPPFQDLAGHVLEQLRGAIVVGHNVTFDLRFLEAEVARCGARMGRPPYFDTMASALRLGSPSRQLAEACDLFGILIPEAHSALEDARATAELFRRCVEHLGPRHVSDHVRYPEGESNTFWPSFQVRAAPFRALQRFPDAWSSLPSWQRWLETFRCPDQRQATGSPTTPSWTARWRTAGSPRTKAPL